MLATARDRELCLPAAYVLMRDAWVVVAVAAQASSAACPEARLPVRCVACTLACSIACWFVPATCTANGVAGTCIDTATCSNQGGTSTAGRELSPACALNSVFARLLRSLSWSCQHRGISVLQFTFSLDLFGVRSAAPRLLGANDSSLQPLPSLVFQHRQRQQGHLRVYQRLRCSRRCLDCWSLPWPFFHW